PQNPTLFPYTTLFRSRHIDGSVGSAGDQRQSFVGDERAARTVGEDSQIENDAVWGEGRQCREQVGHGQRRKIRDDRAALERFEVDRKSTRLNSSHVSI